jgi:hypothetical protein
MIVTRMNMERMCFKPLLATKKLLVVTMSPSQPDLGDRHLQEQIPLVSRRTVQSTPPVMTLKRHHLAPERNVPQLLLEGIILHAPKAHLMDLGTHPLQVLQAPLDHLLLEVQELLPLDERAVVGIRRQLKILVRLFILNFGCVDSRTLLILII